MRRWIATGAVALLAAGPLAGCGGGPAGSGAAPAAPASAGAGARKQATLVLDWYPNGDHAGIYSAQDKGYTRADGLDLTVQVPSGPAAALQEVASGKAQFAVSYEPEVFLARAQGIPVTAIAAIVHAPLNSIITLRSSGITTPAQLAGKTIGTDGLPNTRALLDTVLRHAGVRPSQVKQVTVSEGNVPALLAHKVDAIIGAYWNVEAVEIAQKGQPVNVMRLNKLGVPTYDELVFVTSDKVLHGDPGLVRAFLKAEMQGERFAMAHPRQAAAFVLKASKSPDPPLVDKSVALLQPVWKGAAPRLGYMDPAKWQAFEKWMRAQGVLSKDVPVSAAMTDADLPK